MPRAPLLRMQRAPRAGCPSLLRTSGRPSTPELQEKEGLSMQTPGFKLLQSKCPGLASVGPLSSTPPPRPSPQSFPDGPNLSPREPSSANFKVLDFPGGPAERAVVHRPRGSAPPPHSLSIRTKVPPPQQDLSPPSLPPALPLHYYLAQLRHRLTFRILPLLRVCSTRGSQEDAVGIHV